MRNRTAEIDEKVWSLDKRHHQPEKLHVGIVVTVSQISHRLVVGDKDIDALENSPVLNDNILRMSNFQNILETLGQEIDLQIERPPLDILVVILQIWVISDRLIFRRPAIMLRQHTSQCRLAAADISCYSDVHFS